MTTKWMCKITHRVANYHIENDICIAVTCPVHKGSYCLVLTEINSDDYLNFIWRPIQDDARRSI